MIRLAGVGHSIGSAVILADISLEVPAGQITALIGPNGAGKSTLLGLISRQVPLAGRGSITVDDLDIARADSRALAVKMALVAQHVGVASRLRIRDLIGFGRWPHARGRLGPDDHRKVAQAVERFDLGALADRFLDEVSGGQRQRAFVAMAYVQDTDWLLLDEPLNNLDLRYARTLMAELREMVRAHAKSIVIVLHDLNYAISWADHIVAIKDGRVAFAGATQAVATAENLTALYDTPVTLHPGGGRPFVQHHS